MDNNSFFSIDRLLEIGVGLSLARQMVETMNVCMSQSTVPTVKLQAPSMVAPQVQYYAVIDEQVAGPLKEDDLTIFVLKTKLAEDTLVWKSGLHGWTQARNIPEIYKIILLNK